MENEFGSIRITKYNNLIAKECILYSVDVDKLSLINDITDDGSTAFCIDTSQLFIKHDTTWCEVKING